MQRQEKIELLKSLIRIDSDDGNELAVAELLATVLRAHGVEAHLDPYGDHRANLVAEIGHCQTDRVLAFSGHMDTVGQGDKPWHHEPLGAEIVGDLLYARIWSLQFRLLMYCLLTYCDCKDASKPL